jgi:hypothetical protein
MVSAMVLPKGSRSVNQPFAAARGAPASTASYAMVAPGDGQRAGGTAPSVEERPLNDSSRDTSISAPIQTTRGSS